MEALGTTTSNWMRDHHTSQHLHVNLAGSVSPLTLLGCRNTALPYCAQVSSTAYSLRQGSAALPGSFFTH